MQRRSVVGASLAAVLAAALAAGGCGRGPDPATSQATAAPASATTAATATADTAPATDTTAAETTTTEPAAAQATRPSRPAPVRHRFPVAGCRVSYGRAHHDYPAADMFAARGCAFVAPVAGRVDEVTRSDRWDPASDRGADRGGRSVSLVGVDGVRYYGSHLHSVAPGIAPGTTVRAGQLLGRIGDSGSARGTGTHLHFGISWPTRPGIWWVRRGMVAPAPFLDSWRSGGHLSPVAAVRAARAEAGREVPPCRARC
jgi:peptidoglycan LD-endopeptidase LytH